MFLQGGWEKQFVFQRTVFPIKGHVIGFIPGVLERAFVRFKLNETGTRMK